MIIEESVYDDLDEDDDGVIDLEQVPLNEADLAIGTMDSGRITSIKTQLVELSLVFETLLASLWNGLERQQKTCFQDRLKPWHVQTR